MWPRRKTRKKPFPKELFRVAYTATSSSVWYVYVIQSLVTPVGKKVGFTYVGATNDPVRRFRQHNGELPGGARFTSRFRPWIPRALYGPYEGRTDALKAEYALKKGKRGEGRTRWCVEDSHWCRGEGPLHCWVQDPTSMTPVDPLSLL